MNNQNNFKKVNALLIGATGVGKSLLINAIANKNVVNAGVGRPITQNIEKIVIEDKGLILWDTKGIEAKNYDSTINNIKRILIQSSESLNKNNIIDVAYLCIKESLGRIEKRDFELLSMLYQFKIKTIIVFTDSQYRDVFFYKAVNILNKKYANFIKNRYIRVNSKEYSIKIGREFITVNKTGIDELYYLTKSLVGKNSNKLVINIPENYRL